MANVLFIILFIANIKDFSLRFWLWFTEVIAIEIFHPAHASTEIGIG